MNIATVKGNLKANLESAIPNWESSGSATFSLHLNGELKVQIRARGNYVAAADSAGNLEIWTNTPMGEMVIQYREELSVKAKSAAQAALAKTPIRVNDPAIYMRGWQS